MWTEPTMPFGQSVIVSLLGLSVVFLALICLALAIMVISKILRSVVSDGAKAPAVSDEADKELLAVLMATIGDDLGLPTDKFKILSVTEVK